MKNISIFLRYFLIAFLVQIPMTASAQDELSYEEAVEYLVSVSNFSIDHTSSIIIQFGLTEHDHCVLDHTVRSDQSETTHFARISLENIDPERIQADGDYDTLYLYSMPSEHGIDTTTEYLFPDEATRDSYIRYFESRQWETSCDGLFCRSQGYDNWISVPFDSENHIGTEVSRAFINLIQLCRGGEDPVE